MDGMNGVNALHFDDDQLLDDQIDPVPQFDLFSVENYGQTNLAGHFESALSKFMGETALISAFEQTWPEDRMNVHSGRHDGARNLIDPKRMNGRSGNGHPICIPHLPGFTL